MGSFMMGMGKVQTLQMNQSHNHDIMNVNDNGQMIEQMIHRR